jgi:hypothetical protein
MSFASEINPRQNVLPRNCAAATGRVMSAQNSPTARIVAVTPTIATGTSHLLRNIITTSSL